MYQAVGVVMIKTLVAGLQVYKFIRRDIRRERFRNRTHNDTNPGILEYKIAFYCADAL